MDYLMAVKTLKNLKTKIREMEASIAKKHATMPKESLSEALKNSTSFFDDSELYRGQTFVEKALELAAEMRQQRRL